MDTSAFQQMNPVDIKMIMVALYDIARRTLDDKRHEANTGQYTNSNTFEQIRIAKKYGLCLCKDGCGGEFFKVAGRRTWSVQRRYATRKTNGSYKELRADLKACYEIPTRQKIENAIYIDHNSGSGELSPALRETIRLFNEAEPKDRPRIVIEDPIYPKAK